MFNIAIAIPPSPQLNIVSGCGVAAGAAISIALLLWGRHLGRAFLALSGAAVGMAIGGAISRHFGISLLTSRLVATIVFSLFAMAMARFIWALLAGASCAAIATIVMAWRLSIPIDLEPIEGSLSAYLGQLGSPALNSLGALWQHNAIALCIAAGASAALPAMIFLIRPRLAKIVMTSLLAGTGIVGALLAVIGMASRSAWTGAWNYWLIPACVAGVLFVFGVVLQYRGALAADTAEKERQTKTEEETKKSNQAKG